MGSTPPPRCLQCGTRLKPETELRLPPGVRPYEWDNSRPVEANLLAREAFKAQHTVRTGGYGYHGMGLFCSRRHGYDYGVRAARAGFVPPDQP